MVSDPHFVEHVIYRKAAEMQSQKPMEPLLVDSREAARMLAVSTRKLWAMSFEEENRLAHIRCGRLVRYSVDDLREWIEGQKQVSNR